jgi:hypothetical protein
MASMPELTDISVIRALCEKYDFALSKGFGQNFIINPGIPTKIVDASGVDKRYGVIEIGPGIGVLTKELAKRAAKVVSIEVDERLPPLLAETMAGVVNHMFPTTFRAGRFVPLTQLPVDGDATLGDQRGIGAAERAGPEETRSR